MPFSVCEIPELKNTSALTRTQIKEREGELITKAIKPTDRVILLDERGKEYRPSNSPRRYAGFLLPVARILCS